MPVPASSYNGLIPQATDVPAFSQSQILNNFGAIQTLIDQDHVDFAATGAGKHNQVTFPVQGGAPSFLAGEEGLYNLASTLTSVNELFVHKQTSSGTADIQMTASILSTNSNPGSNVSGWTYLPSGVILKWGHATANGSTTNNFPVGANIPVFTQVMSMIITTADSGATDTNSFARLSAFTNTNFTVYGSQRTATVNQNVTFQYFAIGY